MPSTALMWFRDDLRTIDNPALDAAARHAGKGGRVVAVFVLDEVSPGIRPLGGASRWWLHHALVSLRADLEELGIPLLVREGPAAQVVPSLAQGLGADGLFMSRRIPAAERAVDDDVAAAVGIPVRAPLGTLLFDPQDVRTGQGTPYKVFTPFWNAIRERPLRAQVPEPAPRSMPALDVEAGDIDALGLVDRRGNEPGGWTTKLDAVWEPTQAAAHTALERFLHERLGDYDRARDVPSRPGTSRLSPYLRWGQISPVAVVQAALGELGGEDFNREVAWREFCWHLLAQFPDMPTTNLRAEFDRYPWKQVDDDPALFERWAAGTTGIRLVDAGQNELWATGTMHNRVRMVSASLLVKNLGFDWRCGEAWFWDTLVDADLASNTANWQWVAGCGADAAPYFRIFNPDTQAKRFDPDGAYVQRWLGDTEVEPVVDLKSSRAAALDAYDGIR